MNTSIDAGSTVASIATDEPWGLMSFVDPKGENQSCLPEKPLHFTYTLNGDSDNPTILVESEDSRITRHDLQKAIVEHFVASRQHPKIVEFRHSAQSDSSLTSTSGRWKRIPRIAETLTGTH